MCAYRSSFSDRIFNWIEYRQTLSRCLIGAGLIWISSSVLSTTYSILRKLLRRQDNLIKKYGDENSYAVITGAGGGIGRAFAIELVKSGFNIVAIDFNQNLLDALEKEISSVSDRTVKKIKADFSQSFDEGIFETISQDLEKLDVAFLINNVGIGQVYKYEEYPVKNLYQMISINVIAQVMMTRIIIPNMLKRGKQSAVINLASIASYLPNSYFSMYCGSKAFNRLFAQSLFQEYQDRNIDFLAVTPYYVTTAMTGHADGFLWVKPEECVRGALKDLGKQSQTFGHWKHSLMYQIILSTPWFLKKSASQKSSSKSLADFQAILQKEI